MMNGERHSVDVPISRTLVALGRVRSLRDPATNSMSKFCETSSNNGISLRFEDGALENGSVDNGFRGTSNLGMYELREDHVAIHNGLRKLKSACKGSGQFGSGGTSLRTGEAEWDSNELKRDEAFRNKPLTGRYCGSYRDKALYLTCATPLHDHMEDVASYHAPNFEASFMGRPNNSTVCRKSSRYKHRTKSSEPVGDVSSFMGSSCPSVSDSLSSQSQSLFGNEVVHTVEYNHQGCGINCWPRTPRFRDSKISSDVDDYPLLSREICEVALSGEQSLKHGNGELTTSSETPRSLSQKFRPKSFDELVGQTVVVRSLLSAITTGKITSLYLFHGPRGTGKTCASRIFAAALNCLSLDRHKPCGMCRECILFYTGRNRNIKEVDSARINKTERIRSLIKNTAMPPVSSRFKVFIIDECQLLNGETWTILLNSIEDLSQYVVFVMITPDLDNLPQSALPLSQCCYFPKLKDADIASRLGKICKVEGLDHDRFALDLIATKSNGSLRDAEMMLDQLSLLGKRITMSLAYELIGVVSDDELLELLDLALSSDTSKTVIMARELMRSRIDPMQLTSQLANLIMDILAGKCHEGSSEVRISFCRRHNSEADLQKLSHALKILSDAEKQLRMSKNQTTWLTVALLQLSSMESYASDLNESKLCLKKAHDSAADCDNHDPLISGEGSKHYCPGDENKTYKPQMQEDFKGTLESIWTRSTDLCQSNSLRSILRKQGKLASLYVNQGLVVAELEFHNSNYASRAEKSWKLIASSLQSIVGCNVEIRINLMSCTSETKNSKAKKLSWLFSCSRRMLQELRLTAEHGSESDCSEDITAKPMIMDRAIETRSSDCVSQKQHGCSHKTEAITTLRNSEGNVLSAGSLTHGSLQGDTPKNGLRVESAKECETNLSTIHPSAEEPDVQPNCFAKTLTLHKKLCASSGSSKMAPSVQPQNLALSIPRKKFIQTYLCAAGPCILSGSSDKFSKSFRDEAELREDSDVLCWRTPTFPFKKAWKLRHPRQS